MQNPGDNVVRPERWQGPSDPGDGDGELPPDMSERLARLEGICDGLKLAIEGLRHGQNVILGLMGIGFAVVIAVASYAVVRIDNLPDDFQRMNQTLSAAITATKQQPPQVILVPVPTPKPKPTG